MESQRQKKVSGIIQEEISQIFLSKLQVKGVLITVSQVSVTSDLSIAKVFISIFPTENRDAIFKEIIEQTPFIRKIIGQKLSHVMRIIPELLLKLDVTLDQAEKIDKELKGLGDNPIL